LHIVDFDYMLNLGWDDDLSGVW